MTFVASTRNRADINLLPTQDEGSFFQRMHANGTHKRKKHRPSTLIAAAQAVQASYLLRINLSTLSVL